MALDLLQKYPFADHKEGTLVVLGLGLLLRECWRAVEVEDDDESAPKFLQESLLGKKRASQVIKAIKEVMSGLPSLDTNDERSTEKKLDDSEDRQKVKAGQKKPTKMKRPCTPPLVPSTSKKPFGTQKEDNSPSKNIRSQRQRKPSKKLRGSD